MVTYAKADLGSQGCGHQHEELREALFCGGVGHGEVRRQKGSGSAPLTAAERAKARCILGGVRMGRRRLKDQYAEGRA